MLWILTLLVVYIAFILIEPQFNPPLFNNEGFSLSESKDFVCLVDTNTTITRLYYNDTISNASSQLKHCGKCGNCSTLNDIQIYNTTQQTLKITVTYCAVLSVVLGRSASNWCLNAIRFTPKCQECWIDNIMCDKQKCLMTCILYKLFGRGEFKNGLDPCLNCDESLCGPTFMKCAGANRRRCGIVSDIDRPESEVCDL